MKGSGGGASAARARQAATSRQAASRRPMRILIRGPSFARVAEPARAADEAQVAVVAAERGDAVVLTRLQGGLRRHAARPGAVVVEGPAEVDRAAPAQVAVVAGVD